MILGLLFWISLLGLIYIYVLYPLLVAGLARTKKSRFRMDDPPESSDHFDVLISSHAEGERVKRKVEEIWMAGATIGLRRIVVVLDGVDEEAERALREWTPFGGEICWVGDDDALTEYGVLVISNPERAGKPACLNIGISYCLSAWVVMMDIRQKMGPSCLQALKKHFPEASVHVISGNLEFTDSKSGAAVQVGAYWTYEKWIRRNESFLGCVPGATGACYALRRSAYVLVPEHLVLDDVYLPMAACAEGGRCILEREAIIFDAPSTNMKQERLRKRRTIGGMVQLLVHQPGWALPGGHRFWFSFLSHKGARLLGPILLITALVSNVFLLCSSFYALLLILQGAAYLLALTASGLKRVPVIGKIAQIAQSFLSLNLVVPVGFWMWARGEIRPVWDRAYVNPEKEKSP